MLQQCIRPLHGAVLQAIALTEAADRRFAYQSVNLAEASETPKMTKPLLAGRCAPLLPSRQGVILESSKKWPTSWRLLVLPSRSITLRSSAKPSEQGLDDHDQRANEELARGRQLNGEAIWIFRL